MRLPEQEFTLDSFIEYLDSHVNQVFGKEDRKWLKVYLVYSSDNWRELLRPFGLSQLGHIYHIKIPPRYETKEEHGNAVSYYVHELTQGLLMFFSSSRERDYEITLKRLIDSTRGLTEMWVTPDSFEKVKNHLISKHEARIYRFIARRNLFTKIPARFRPDVERRLSYSGEDATEVLKETREAYGITPTSIDFRLGHDTLKITNDGLFLLRAVNRSMLRVVLETIDLILAEQIRIRKTSGQLTRSKFRISLKDWQIDVPTVNAGTIILPKVMLTGHMIDRLLSYKEEWEEMLQEEKASKEFSFIDVGVQQGSGIFSATAVDEKKGTVFGINGGENVVVLVPKYRTTYESFIRFFRLVSELIDDEAFLTTFGEMNAR